MSDGKLSHFIDGEDESNSNWLRYVNCPRCENEQNLVAFQYRGEIYYHTYKDITPGTELLVWYGDKFAKELGIPLGDDNDCSESAETSSSGKRTALSSEMAQSIFCFEDCAKVICILYVNV